MKNEESCYYGRECFDDCRLFSPQDTFAAVVEVSETMYLEDVLYVSFKHLKLMWDILKERNQACRSLGIYIARGRDFESCGDKLIFFESLDDFDRLAVSFCKLFNSVVGEAADDKHPVKYVLITLEDIYVKTRRGNL